ncbi:MAG: HP0495 family protein [Saezia sp.]
MTKKIIASESNTESLLTFPADFPLKIMGSNAEGFFEAIAELVKNHAPEFDTATIEKNHSKKGNYLSLRVTVRATSKEQLDNLYRALTSHPMVKVVF